MLKVAEGGEWEREEGRGAEPRTISLDNHSSISPSSPNFFSSLSQSQKILFFPTSYSTCKEGGRGGGGRRRKGREGRLLWHFVYYVRV